MQGAKIAAKYRTIESQAAARPYLVEKCDEPAYVNCERADFDADERRS